MLNILDKAADIAAQQGEICAAGTDVYARRRLGISRGAIQDISRLPDLKNITIAGKKATIGALTTITTVAEHASMQANYPALAKAAGGLATPQIRNMGTMGGALLQRNRCWYYRNPVFSCYKKGGNSCPARAGNHHYGVAFDLGPCVAVHPATLGMALLAYEATIETDSGDSWSIQKLYGDGSDPTKDHQLDEGKILTKIHLGAPVEGEKGAYFRTISRHEAEWALVESVARLVVENNKITFARVAIGAVANIPLRLPEVEHFLEGQPATNATFIKAAKIAQIGANPLPMTDYKVELIYGTVLETLLRTQA